MMELENANEYVKKEHFEKLMDGVQDAFTQHGATVNDIYTVFHAVLYAIVGLNLVGEEGDFISTYKDKQTIQVKTIITKLKDFQEA